PPVPYNLDRINTVSAPAAALPISKVPNETSARAPKAAPASAVIAISVPEAFGLLNSTALRCGTVSSSTWSGPVDARRFAFPIPRLAWPTDAERRSPSQDPGAPPATAGTPSARGVGGPASRAAPGGPGPDQRAPRPAAGRRAAGGRPAAGTGACRRARVRPDSPPREPRGGASDRGARGWSAWSARLGPSGGCDAPRPPDARSPGSDSP